MILIGGANDSYQNGQGAFQEAPQIETARPYAKYAARPDSVKRLPFYVEQAVRSSIYGRPGAVYLDLPGDIITGSVEVEELEYPPKCPAAPRSRAPLENVDAAWAALTRAERPLVIVGKGAAYSRAEDEVRAFLEGALAVLVAVVRATDEDHRPAVGPGVRHPGDAVNHARAGNAEADSGATRQIANGRGGVAGGLLIAEAEELDALALGVHCNGDNRDADDPEHVLDALLLERLGDDLRASNLCHERLLQIRGE
jgi:hypothetical protein